MLIRGISFHSSNIKKLFKKKKYIKCIKKKEIKEYIKKKKKEKKNRACKYVYIGWKTILNQILLLLIFGSFKTDWN